MKTDYISEKLKKTPPIKKRYISLLLRLIDGPLFLNDKIFINIMHSTLYLSIFVVFLYLRYSKYNCQKYMLNKRRNYKKDTLR